MRNLTGDIEILNIKSEYHDMAFMHNYACWLKHGQEIHVIQKQSETNLHNTYLVVPFYNSGMIMF